MTIALNTNRRLHILLSADWQSAGVKHSDHLHIENFNLWRDLELLPLELQPALAGQEFGQYARQHFDPGELVEPWQARHCLDLNPAPSGLRLKNGRTITPQLGRFYPRGLLSGYAPVFSEDRRPMRFIEREGRRQRYDLNHPLSVYPLTLGVTLLDSQGAPEEHGGRCHEAVRELLEFPGMKAPYAGRATEFLHAQALQRVDESSDSSFYARPRLVQHLDARAREQVAALYGQHLRPAMRVLDLMASWDSHLPPSLPHLQVSGLGLNAEELAHNPRLQDFQVHDLNTNAQLPYRSQHFDAVICTASVEYLIDPPAVFREVARVLKPGGSFINVFSNRWFPPKVTALWSDLHEFERPALVCDYYRLTHRFTGLQTYSVRGLARPADDPHIRQSSLSDPIHAVWGFAS